MKTRLNLMLDSGTMITHVKRREDNGIVVLSATDFASNATFLFDMETGKQLYSDNIKLSEREEAKLNEELKKVFKEKTNVGA